MASSSERPRNHLLTSLSPADFDLIESDLEAVVFSARHIVEIPHKRIKYVYFPEAGIMSVVAVGASPKEIAGASSKKIETGIIGWEGMSGVTIVLGDDRSPHSTYIQTAGHGQRIEAERLREAMQKSASLTLCFLRFAQTFMTQAAHTALANGRATVEERLARWLLMAHDRSHTDELAFTHDFLALMLGVRRAGVTTALHSLEGQGLVTAQRGLIVVTGRSGLKTIANGFYGIPEAEHTRLTGWRAREPAR